MLFREGVKLYIARQSSREGSRIKSKLVMGALALSLLPVVFLVAFGYAILNRTLDKWFSRAGRGRADQSGRYRDRAGRRSAATGRRRWPTGWRRCRNCATEPRTIRSCAPKTASPICASRRRRSCAPQTVHAAMLRRGLRLGRRANLIVGLHAGVDLAGQADRDRPLYAASTTRLAAQEEVSAICICCSCC